MSSRAGFDGSGSGASSERQIRHVCVLSARHGAESALRSSTPTAILRPERCGPWTLQPEKDQLNPHAKCRPRRPPQPERPASPRNGASNGTDSRQLLVFRHHERNGLVAQPSIVPKIIVQSDQACSRVDLRQGDERGIAQVHARILRQKFTDASRLGREHGYENQSALVDQLRYHRQRRAQMSQPMASLGCGGFSGGKRFVNNGQSLNAPVVPLVVAIEKADQRPRIHQIVNG